MSGVHSARQHSSRVQPATLSHIILLLTWLVRHPAAAHTLVDSPQYGFSPQHSLLSGTHTAPAHTVVVAFSPSASLGQSFTVHCGFVLQHCAASQTPLKQVDVAPAWLLCVSRGHENVWHVGEQHSDRRQSVDPYWLHMPFCVLRT
jgi:hypothetical protein